MKHIFIAVLLLIGISASAQVKTATLQASGLTCSMCSNAIYKALQKISFVQDVQSDIKNSSYNITFKEGSTVDIDALKKAVTGAGFSVARLSVVAHFDNVKIENDTHVKLDGKTFHFLNVPAQTLNGDKTITVVDKNFVTNKEYKKYSQYTKMKCYETGTMESCCKKNGSAGERIYHVTI